MRSWTTVSIGYKSGELLLVVLSIHEMTKVLLRDFTSIEFRMKEK